MYLINEKLFALSYLPSDEMGAECEGVTAGEGMWWLVPLSFVRTGDSVFTVLDADVADFKSKRKKKQIHFSEQHIKTCFQS